MSFERVYLQLASNFTSQMLKHCGRAEVSRSSSYDYSTFELFGSKGAGCTFARSASAGSHTGPLLSKSPEVKEPVVRLHVARGPTLPSFAYCSINYTFNTWCV